MCWYIFKPPIRYSTFQMSRFIRRANLVEKDSAVIRVSDRTACNGLNALGKKTDQWTEITVWEGGSMVEVILHLGYCIWGRGLWLWSLVTVVGSVSSVLLLATVLSRISHQATIVSLSGEEEHFRMERSETCNIHVIKLIYVEYVVNFAIQWQRVWLFDRVLCFVVSFECLILKIFRKF